jgi:hypothetical protein
VESDGLAGAARLDSKRPHARQTPRVHGSGLSGRYMIATAHELTADFLCAGSASALIRQPEH